MENPRLIDLAGQRFGRWTVLEKAGNEVRGAAMWRCVCDCGEARVCRGGDLRNGKSASCGCGKRKAIDSLNERRAAKHALGRRFSKTALYQCWHNMRSRCNDPVRDAYGARGIKVCAEWQGSYECFRAWALSAGYADGLTIERVDYNGNYEPANCTWIPGAEQAKNRSIVHKAPDGRLWSEIAASNGITAAAFKCRTSAGGWPMELAATWPLGKKRAKLPRDPVTGQYLAPAVSTWRR